VKLAIIAAVARNRAMGIRGSLPWHISEDLRRFKQLTTGHAVLMGRKTYESIGKPLVNRRNVVISSRTVPGIESYPSVPAALEALHDQEKVFVIGGGQIYAQLLEKADEIFLTLVDRDVEADTFFPEYEVLLESSFSLTHHELHDGFEFRDYVRVR